MRNAFASEGIEHVADDKAEEATQKFQKSSILLEGETSFSGVRPIAQVSKVAMSVPDTAFVKRIYVDKSERARARDIVRNVTGGEERP